MCGIFAYLGTQMNLTKLTTAFNALAHRGPDHHQCMKLRHNLFFGFHRLSINGLTESSNQPLQLGSTYLMCNGEIYNHRALEMKYDFKVQSQSDCEVILHLYQKFGFQRTLELLDGVFAIILYDEIIDTLFIGNDPIGIRPLYYGESNEFMNDLESSNDTSLGLYFASEPKALAHCEKVHFYPPGSWSKIDLLQHQIDFQQYYFMKYTPMITLETHTFEEICNTYRTLLSEAVSKRMMSDRPIATLLSGGLDSSLVSALIAQELKKTGASLKETVQLTPELETQQKLLKGRLHTFSIGLPGSPDLYYAQKVSDHIGSIHHHVEVSEETFLQAIPEVIVAIQSWDITTVRASVGNYLIAKYIKENTDFTVIFNGDVSEEINASYYYSKFAPSAHDFSADNIKLLQEVHQYDVLRSARCVEAHSLESRTPFADKNLIQFVMSLDPVLKMFGQPDTQSIEKYVLRKAFENTGILPDEVLWRPKEAFSDGVSEKTRSWHQIIGEWIETQVSDDEFAQGHKIYAYHCPPTSKESYFYRKIFEEILPGKATMIQDYWMPRFLEGIKDPSARVLHD